MKAGELRQRFTFSKRQVTNDGLGNEQGSWLDQFTVWAQRRMLVGGESVMASRLEGVSPAVVKVRYSIATKQVTTDWRCTDARTNEIYNIRAVTPGEQNTHIDFLCQKGVAT